MIRTKPFRSQVSDKSDKLRRIFFNRMSIAVESNLLTDFCGCIKQKESNVDHSRYFQEYNEFGVHQGNKKKVLNLEFSSR